jgi:PPP family 3-phenylpropionic acid transporter
MLLTLFSFRRTESLSESSGELRKVKIDSSQIGIMEFIKRNRMFCLMNTGMAGLFFSNAVLTNYMAQISADVNGTTEDLGRILSLMALLEIPTMLLYGRIAKRFSSAALIRTAAAGFTAKIVICYLAGSVAALFAAQFFQLIAFGLLMPAMVYFTGEIMEPGEAVKGQSLFTMMATLSTIAASLAGGWLLDASGAKALTLAASAVTAAGAAIVMLTAGRVASQSAAGTVVRRRRM